MASHRLPDGSMHIRASNGKFYYEGKWRHSGRQVKRRIGEAWLESDGNGGSKRRRGRVPEGYFDEQRAYVRLAELIAKHAEDSDKRPRLRDARFEDVADDWLDHMSHADRAKPSTLSDYRYNLRRPGPRKIGDEDSKARIMEEFEGRLISSITTEDIARFLNELDREKISPRSVNKHRQLLHTIFNYATRRETYGLPENPVSETEKRREPSAAPIDTFTTEEIEATVKAARQGLHRSPHKYNQDPEYLAERKRMDTQDAAMFLIAAQTGMRQGEIRALRWKSVDLSDRRIVIEASVSAGKIETPKSRRSRVVPMTKQVEEQLKALSKRPMFTGRNDFVFCRADGGILDGRSISKRFRKAQKAANVRPRRFHDLRHTFGSVAIRKFDLVSVKDMMGHAKIATTQRYLHSRPRADDAAKLAEAFDTNGS